MAKLLEKLRFYVMDCFPGLAGDFGLELDTIGSALKADKTPANRSRQCLPQKTKVNNFEPLARILPWGLETEC